MGGNWARSRLSMTEQRKNRGTRELSSVRNGLGDSRKPSPRCTERVRLRGKTWNTQVEEKAVQLQRAEVEFSCCLDSMKEGEGIFWAPVVPEPKRDESDGNLMPTIWAKGFEMMNSVVPQHDPDRRPCYLLLVPFITGIISSSSSMTMVVMCMHIHGCISSPWADCDSVASFFPSISVLRGCGHPPSVHQVVEICSGYMEHWVTVVVESMG